MDEARHRDIFKSPKSRFELGATRMPLLLVKIVMGMESTMVCYIKLVDGLYIQSLNKKSSLTPYFLYKFSSSQYCGRGRNGPSFFSEGTFFHSNVYLNTKYVSFQQKIS